MRRRSKVRSAPMGAKRRGLQERQGIKEMTTSSADRPSTKNPLLTISEVIAELGIPRSTFYRWRQLSKGPRSIKLPNGGVRIRRSELDRWIATMEDRSR